jgi:enamine deaminase RidA (YjgF/YER057c/UK114 family)
VLRCAGQTSNDENGAPMHAGDMGAQISLALDNLETVLKAAGMSLSNVVRVHLYTTHMDDFLQQYGVMAQRFAAAGIQPAATLLGVTKLFAPEIMIEIEAEAVA